jgi:ABC-type transport system involved in multi-copper enzyme maturation permease subunit
MLWYKSWLETRSRFLIGLALLMCSAAASVLTYPTFQQLLTTLPSIDLGGEIGRKVREAAIVASTYRGYIWSHLYRQNLIQLWTIFAVILGTGGLLSQMSGGGGLFTLSLPVSRRELLTVRAAAGLAELLILAVVPSLLVPLVSPAIGQSYSLGDSLVHAMCLFVAGAVFFSLSFLLSTVFSDVWRPLLSALFAAGMLAVAEQFVDGLSRYSVIGAMSGESYFRGGGLPWPGLFVSVALSAAMLYGAVVNLARRDF